MFTGVNEFFYIDREAMVKRSKQVSFQVGLLPAVAIPVAGCATPVGVRYLDPKQVQRTLTANVLSSDEVSAPTAQILNRAGLWRRAIRKNNPAGSLLPITATITGY